MYGWGKIALDSWYFGGFDGSVIKKYNVKVLPFRIIYIRMENTRIG
jgi:hypothetical protein